MGRRRCSCFDNKKYNTGRKELWEYDISFRDCQYANEAGKASDCHPILLFIMACTFSISLNKEITLQIFHIAGQVYRTERLTNTQHLHFQGARCIGRPNNILNVHDNATPLSPKRKEESATPLAQPYDVQTVNPPAMRLRSYSCT